METVLSSGTAKSVYRWSGKTSGRMTVVPGLATRGRNRDDAEDRDRASDEPAWPKRRPRTARLRRTGTGMGSGGMASGVRSPRPEPERPMSRPESAKTIDQIFTEFLAEQEARLSDATYRKYEDIIEYLFRGYLERYHPGHNDQEGSAAITARRHLLRDLRCRGRRLRVFRVPRLLHAAQGHRRRRDDEGRGDGDQEAGEVAVRRDTSRRLTRTAAASGSACSRDLPARRCSTCSRTG